MYDTTQVVIYYTGHDLLSETHLGGKKLYNEEISPSASLKKACQSDTSTLEQN